MRVDSLSESLSYSSKYAFHSPGGIDRDVWIFAVPPVHMSRLRIEPVLDEAFYFPDGSHAGYAWHHGFWRIIDAWRRPKPEWWITKRVFSPVWFPVRELGAVSANGGLDIPVENRYSFTNFRDLPVPAGPAPRVTDDGTRSVTEGSGFSLVFDRGRGEFEAGDPRHRAVRENGIELIVEEHYDRLAGTMRWRMDGSGRGTVAFPCAHALRTRTNRAPRRRSA
ncbi:MAG: hypothetical protein FJ297_03650 [Planctomycetes bacterium]|nr:hypothetical protein [Planctomycetota bacterium]